MPGRCKGMAKKATALEMVVLNVFRRISKACPAIHKETQRRHGVSAPASPWVSVHRLVCELVLAADELGQHARKAAGIPDRGPIRQALMEADLQRLRQYQRGATGRTLGELVRLQAAANEVKAALPVQAESVDEMTWAHLALHDPDPDFEKAPSKAAISLWLSLEHSGPGFLRWFLGFYLRTRIRLEGWKEPPVAPTDPPEEQTEEEDDQEAYERLFGPDAEWRKAVPPALSPG